MFDARPSSGHPPLQVAFTDLSKPGAEPIIEWRWDFGDGTTSADHNPMHVYYLAGDYTVSLTVTSALGSHSLKKKASIKVSDSATVGGIGSAGGAVEAEGASLTVPPGALKSQVVFGIAPNEGDVPLNFSESETVASNVYSISQDQPDDLSSDPQSPMVLRISFVPGMVPEGFANNVNLQIIAKLDSGIGVPIMGSIDGSAVAASISGMPRHAYYAVVVRPSVEMRDFPVDSVKTLTSYHWPANQWRWSFTADSLQALTALRLSTIYAPANFDRRDWDTLENSATLSDTEDAIAEIHRTARQVGFISPSMVSTADGQFTLILYPMNNPPIGNFLSIDVITYATTVFGSMVIDPAQLDAISKRNAAQYVDLLLHRGDISNAQPEDYLVFDQAQKLDFRNAFGEGLFHAVFRGYDYPMFSKPGPVDLNALNKPKNIPFYLGFENGLAAYVSQISGKVMMARALGLNEYSMLSEPLFAPFSNSIPLYSYATQDFFSYVAKRFTSIDTTDPLKNPLTFIADSFVGVLERVRQRLSGPPAADDFDEALVAARKGTDVALQRFFALSLPQIFWEYTRARAYENDDSAAIRPTDAVRSEFTLNEDRFDAASVFKYTFTTANQIYTISGTTFDDIPPLSSRAIVLECEGTYGELTIEANSDDWSPDPAGNSVKIRVYKDGQDGTDLATQLALPNFGSNAADGFSKVIILVSNVAMDRTFSVAITATLKTLTGTLSGHVISTQAEVGSLANVSVAIVATGSSALLASVVTDGTGNFTAPNLPPGRVTVSFKKAGYIDKTVTATVVANRTAFLSVEMTPVR